MKGKPHIRKVEGLWRVYARGRGLLLKPEPYFKAFAFVNRLNGDEQ